MVRVQKRKTVTRERKAQRTRRRIRVGSTRPRLSVFRSLTNIYTQIIDDTTGRTLVAASSQDKELRPQLAELRKTDVAQKVGALLAERARAAGVTQVAFDRGRYRYQGRVRALGEAAREAGLQF